MSDVILKATYETLYTQDDLCAIIEQLLDGGQSCVDAVLVGDDAVLHRDVEVAADQNLLAAVILVVDRLLT